MGNSLIEQYRKRKGELETSGKIWEKMKSGGNFYRILPNPDDGGFYAKALLHSNLESVGLNKVKAIMCGKSFGGNKCAVCELIEELLSTKNASDIETAKKISPQEKCFSWVIRLNSGSDTEPPEGSEPKVLTYGKQIEGQLITLYVDEDYGDFTDISNGRNITIDKSGSGRDTSYTVVARPKTTAFKFDLANLRPLSEAIAPRKYEEVLVLLAGGDASDVDGDKEGDTNKKAEEKKAEPPKQEKKEEPKKEEPKVENKAVPNPADGDKPKCFCDRETFSPRSASCRSCPHIEPCKKAFVEIGF